jgi:hypothetical protein
MIMQTENRKDSQPTGREEAAFVCSHVFEKTRPILYVSREGGDWQFLCGEEHSPTEKPRVVGAAHLFARDPSLREVADLRPDWEAERIGVGTPWARRAC